MAVIQCSISNSLFSLMQRPPRHRVTISILPLFLYFSLHGQVDPKAALQKLYNDYPQEKIYAWLNKPAYVAGETIWFKLYVFSGYELSNISTNAYVEFLDNKKKIISNLLIPLFVGTGQGSIELNENLPEDVYYLRVYTRWMLNFNESFQFITTIPVINTASQKRLIEKGKSWTAKAYAEGGSLLNGITSKIAIRLNSFSELPQSWSGYVFEKDNPLVKLIEFKSLDHNVASFYFTPVENKQYYAFVSDESGLKQTIPLPAVQKSGISLKVENLSDSLVCTLDFKTPPETGTIYRMIGQMQHQLVFYANVKRRDGKIMINVPTKDLYNGLLHLTLFDESGNVLNERMVFTNPDKLNVVWKNEIKFDLSGEPRKTNKLDIQVDSLSWSSYAMSVTNEDAPSSTMTDNLISALWLTSDISQPVQYAASYFNDPDAEKLAALDALLITEKWTRFSWNEILRDQFPVIKYLPHNYITYSGSVNRNKKLLPLKEVTMVLYAPDSSSQFLLSRTDSLGNLFLDNLMFEGSIKAFYQLNEKKGNPKNININFERENKFFPYQSDLPAHKYILAPRISNSTVPDWVNNSLVTMKNEDVLNNQYKTLREIILKSKLKSAKEELDEKLTSNFFRSFNDISFDFVNEEQNAIGYSNILQWLDGRVAGLNVEMRDGVFIPYIRGSQAAIYLDEMPFDADGLTSVSISDIALVKVIKGSMAFAAGGGGGGVIAIYTARGNMRPAQTEPSLNAGILKGYNTEKRFPQPVYGKKDIKEPQMDVRDQLLWTSLLFPDKSVTMSQQEFINNDNPKRLRLIIQGMTNDGFPVYIEKILEPGKKAF